MEPAESAREPLRVVAIGASEGGLEVLAELLRGVHLEVPVALVLAVQASSTREGPSASFLTQHTLFSVRDARDGEEPAPGTVYLAPPQRHVVLRDGRLRLEEAQESVGPEPSVHRLFASVAEELGELAIGVLLSGTGSDGALGARALEAAGGVVLLQDPAAAANATTLEAEARAADTDVALSAAQLGRALEALLRAEGLHREDGASEQEAEYESINEVVLAQTSFRLGDFRATTLRRQIARRCGALGVRSLAEYAERLRRDATEAEALVRAMCIGVTAFFRDQAPFRSLAKELDALVREHPDEGVLRAWVPACSTGEEAYSVAMLFEEALRASGKRALQYLLFASDWNEQALETARLGVYSKADTEALPRALLERYFEPAGERLRVVKKLRNRVVFARQNLLEDAPFARLHLVSCRNLLIYLVPSARRQLLEVLHYALNPGGLLLLGRSESVESSGPLFTEVDGAERLLRRAEVRAPSLPNFRRRAAGAVARREGERSQARTAEELAGSASASLLARYAPPSVVLDDADRVVHFQGKLEGLLRFPQGRAELGLYALLEEPLRAELRALVGHARRSEREVRGGAWLVPAEGRTRLVSARVWPLGAASPGHLVVAFEGSTETQRDEPPRAEGSEGLLLRELEGELSSAREQLRLVGEELECSNTELSSVNEELRSVNQELQSTNEELQTSNEELQTSNEELRAQHQRLREIVQGTGAGTWELHLPSGEVRVDEQWAKILGYELEELLPLTVEKLRSFGAPEDRQGAQESLAKHLAGELAIFTRERRVRHRDGSWRWVFDRGAVVSRDAAGKPEWMRGIRIDVTARREAELTVERKEAQLRALVRSAPAALAMFDREMRYLEASERYRRNLGLGDESLVGRVHYEVLPMGQAHRPAHLRALAGESVLVPEVRVVRDGKEAWNRAELEPWYELDGSLGGVILCLEDITEEVQARKVLERSKEELEQLVAGRVAELAAARDALANVVKQRDEALAVSERNLSLVRNMIEALPYGVVLFDAELRATAWNTELVRLLELPPELVAAPSWTAEALIEHMLRRGELPGEEPRRVLARLLDAAASTSTTRKERRMRNGRWVEVRARALGGGEVLLAYSDVTALRESEVRASNARARLELATSAGVVGIWSIDFATGEVEADEVARRLTGLPLERALRVEDLETFLAAMSADTKGAWFGSPGVRPEASERPFDFEFTPTGLGRSLSNRGTILFDVGGGRVSALGVMTDITERKQLESVLRDRVDAATRAKEQATLRAHQLQKMELVGNLTSGIAHDFNNLLSVFMLATETLQERVNPADEEAREAVDDLLHGVERAVLLTRQLLGFGRATSNERIPVDVDAAARAICALLPRLAGGRIAVKVESEADAWTLGSRANIEQVVLNLAVNARDAMPEGGTLTCRVWKTEREVRLSVADTGVGMDEATCARVFEPFFTTKATGTGLGLATVQEIAQRLGGTVELESAVGRGTTVTLALPRIEAPATRQKELSPRQRAPEPGRALLVEDDPLVRRGTQRLLESAGFEVTSVANGAEALGFLERSSAVDLVVTDLSMPELDGSALAERIAALRPELPVVMISGNQSPPPSVLARPRRSFVRKPTTRESLVAAIDRARQSSLSS